MRMLLRQGLALAGMSLLAGCSGVYSLEDHAPAADYPSQCEAAVYADPTVKDLLMKSAGSNSFAKDHDDALKYAKLNAARRCLQQRGQVPLGGGVERPNAQD